MHHMLCDVVYKYFYQNAKFGVLQSDQTYRRHRATKRMSVGPFTIPI